jgi:hypothetical protein
LSKAKKKNIEEEVVQIEEIDNSGIEHIPIYGKNLVIEDKKREARKKAIALRESIGNKEAVVITTDGIPKLVSKLSIAEKQAEIMRCATNPIYFIETYFTIFDQTRGEEGEIVPFKLFDFQKELIQCFRDHKLNIANKYRQAGISTATSAYIAWYIAFNSDRTVAIVADKLETAVSEMMKDVVDFLDSCPSWLVPQPDGKDNEKHKIYSNNSQIKAFSPTSLRGYTPTLLFWDETAWAENGEKFWTAARPAVLNTGGRAIFVSTPNGLDPIFYKTFDSATKGKSKFNAVELWWFNDPRYIHNKETGELDLVWYKKRGRQDQKMMVDKNFSKEKRIQLHREGWEASSSWMEDQILEYNGDMKKLAQELLCSFLGSGDNFIAEEFMIRIKDDEIKTPISQEYVDNNMWIFEDADPDASYVQTIDVSSGYGNDYSAINILKLIEVFVEKTFKKGDKEIVKKVKTHKIEQVAEYYGKIKPSELGEIAYTYGKRYNNAYTIIDAYGYGAQTIEKLFELGYDEKFIHYSEISHKPTRDRLNGYIKAGQKILSDGKVSKIDLIPGFFVGGSRASMLIEFQRSVNMGDLLIRSQRLYDELMTFVTVPGNRVADHKRSFHDDTIMSMAMGVFIVFQGMFETGDSKDRIKKMLDAMTKIDNNTTIIKEKKNNNDTRTPDHRTSPNNPYGGNSWMFQGLDKRRK